MIIKILMWSGSMRTQRALRFKDRVCSSIQFSKDETKAKRVQTEQQTSAETLTEISERQPKRRYQRVEGMTLMNDDFRDRELVCSEKFILRKMRLIKCEVWKTEKFWYLTVYDHKADLHYKLRLTKDTGETIFMKFREREKHFKDHIFQDEIRRFYFIAPVPPFERKFYFTPMQPSVADAHDEHDLYIRQEIGRLDRTLFIYQIFDREQ